jgi:hypothetical protein
MRTDKQGQSRHQQAVLVRICVVRGGRVADAIFDIHMAQLSRQATKGRTQARNQSGAEGGGNNKERGHRIPRVFSTAKSPDSICTSSCARKAEGSERTGRHT